MKRDLAMMDAKQYFLSVRQNSRCTIYHCDLQEFLFMQKKHNTINDFMKIEKRIKNCKQKIKQITHIYTQIVISMLRIFMLRIQN